MPIPLGILAVAGAGAAGGGAFDLIETTVLSSTATDVTFNSIPQDYKHLQVRMTVRNGQDITGTIRIRPNGDTASNYRTHFLRGTGSDVQSGNFASIGRIDSINPASSGAANAFGGVVLDILDFANTSKNKTMRVLGGAAVDSAGGPLITLTSILWNSTNAITSLTINCWDGNFAVGSRFSLYGVK